jgi:hypothetical protein
MDLKVKDFGSVEVARITNPRQRGSSSNPQARPELSKTRLC